MPNTLSRITEFYGTREARVSPLISDKRPTPHIITAVANAGATVTATIDSTVGMFVGQLVTIAGIAGFTTNNPNGLVTVASIVDATHFTYVVLAAPTGVYGSGGTATFAPAAVYGTAVEVPDMHQVMTTPKYITKSSRGGGHSVSTRTRKDTIAVTFGFESLSLDALAVMTGDTVLATGADPAGAQTFIDLDEGKPLPEFMFEARCNAVDEPAGDGHIVIYRMSLDGNPVGFGNDDFSPYSWSGTANRRKSDHRRGLIVLNGQEQPYFNS